MQGVLHSLDVDSLEGHLLRVLYIAIYMADLEAMRAELLLAIPMGKVIRMLHAYTEITV